ncbi:MAG: hypothetical protein LBG27_11885 [Spirochaetaceae bacterium]|nr:hypothetical protein [Spirochaetaceae bacterium]
MHKPRELRQGVWYGVRTEVNIGEPLFRLPEAVVLLHRVLRKVKKFYPFELRGLRLEGAWLVFYIRPEDGFQLPLIMQLVKQWFSLEFNGMTGRRGHLWGERYGSEILEGEPPAREAAVDWAAIDKSANTPLPPAMAYTLTWDSLRSPGMTITTSFSALNVAKTASPPR